MDALALLPVTRPRSTLVADESEDVGVRICSRALRKRPRNSVCSCCTAAFCYLYIFSFHQTLVSSETVRTTASIILLSNPKTRDL